MGRLNWNKPHQDGEAKAPRPSGEWEIPQPSEPGANPWLAPGNLRAPHLGQAVNTGAPFHCCVCGASLRLEGAYAHGGDVFCFEDRPDGSVSGLNLPGAEGPGFGERILGQGRLGSALRWVFAQLTKPRRRRW
jgi:hypothetical protein